MSASGVKRISNEARLFLFGPLRWYVGKCQMHKILPTQIFNKETTTFILDSEDILLCENFFEYQAK